MRTQLLVVSLLFLGATPFSAAIDAALGPEAPINPLLFGSNSVHEKADDPASSPAYRALVRNLKVRAIRYPSGSPASFWDWKTGHFIPDAEITRIWPPGQFNWMLELVEETRHVPDGMLGPVAFMHFGQSVNTEVQWMLNLTTREQDQVEVIENLKHNGAKIKYIEMDNETYFWGAEFGEINPGEVYAQRMQAISPALRSLYPGVQIGAVTREDDLFTEHFEDEAEGVRMWNKHIMQEQFRASFDALILHHYVMKQQRLDPYTTDIDRGKAFLAYPQATLERAARLIHKRFGPYKMWITEFNVIAYYTQFHGKGESAKWMLATRDTGWNAIYQAGFMITGMGRPDAIEILNHHSIKNLDWGWGLGLPVDETHGRLTKMGQLFSHMSSLTETHSTMLPLHFSDNPSLGVTIEGDSSVRALHGAAMKSDQGLAVFVINRSDVDLPLNLPAATNYATCEVTNYPAAENAPASVIVNYTLETPIWKQGPMEPTVKTISIPGQEKPTFLLPRFSLTILEFKSAP